MPKPPKSTEIESLKHQEKRTNIPPIELRNFLTDSEKTQTTTFYPRDPALDPQLVWKGKETSDQEPLAIPTVPIYIQEKIHPQALIEDLRQFGESRETQLNLFADFGEMPFEDQVDFYNHEQNWTNRLILGDSLMVMNSLAEKENLKGQVQMIYLDPPYGIKFNSNWQVSTRKRDVKDGKAEEMTRQPEQVKAFRDTWELGIHSYLAYLRDRLLVARELLTESGSVFVQISDENLHLIRCILDEIFGKDNFVSIIPFVTTSSQTSALLPTVCDFIIWYAKSKDKVQYHQLYTEKSLGGEGSSKYNKVLFKNGEKRSLKETMDQHNQILPENSRVFRLDTIVSQSGSEKSDFPIEFKKTVFKLKTGHWKTHKIGMQRLIKAYRIEAEGASLAYVRFLDDFPAYPIGNVWTDFASVQSRIDPKVYVVQTATKIIQRCILMTTRAGDLVLDPTCGSGTTAYVAEQWGRRWITIDTSRVALALARARLMGAKFPYYLLKDTPEGLRKLSEVDPEEASKKIYQMLRDLRHGFVYKRVPHITLKSIANNAEIDTVHEKYQPPLQTLLEQFNQALKQNLQEWEVPREADSTWKKNVQELHQAWWNLRQKRQQEIDEAIQRKAEYETLYDQPYEDKKRVRVSGPFTVETLAPHRFFSPSDLIEEHPFLQPTNAQEPLPQSVSKYQMTILENLRKSGIQNTQKQERLNFETLELYSGNWLHLAGEFLDHEGLSKRVAISLGPEHGTVGTEQIREAAKEAVQGELDFDLLVVCGFSFDPHVSEEVRKIGRLQVLITRMNPDLAMGNDLLKKTGSGNLFLVFGEPDVLVKTHQGQVTVEILGVDVYDPTTGQLRSHNTEGIACWFIDTNYNGESFFVRQAYFTGANDPYENLRKTLKSEVNREAWDSLNATVSRAFPMPASGKIAVKVINHYGDEVLKVYPLGKSSKA